VPIGAKVQEFLASIEGYPFQAGSSLSVDGINYRSIKAMQILKQMEKSGFPVSR
jgi:arylsulfatase